MEELIAKKQENCILQALYQNMLARLVMFIEASRNRDWSLYLRSAKALIQDFSSMDWIKYSRMWVVYIADMTKLQTEDPEVWDSFVQGNFSCQKSKTPGTTFGRDHAREQMNKISKTRRDNWDYIN